MPIQVKNTMHALICGKSGSSKVILGTLTIENRNGIEMEGGKHQECLTSSSGIKPITVC